MNRTCLLLTISILFFTTLICAQPKVNVDSLLRVSENSEKIDISAYKKLFDYYQKNNIDLLFEKGKEMLTKAIDDGDELAEMTARFYLADYYSERGYTGLALENLYRAKNYFERIDAALETVEVLNGIGNVHYRRGEFQDAVLWYLRSMSRGEGMENVWLLNLAKLNLGRCYIQLKDTLKGEAIILDYIEQARKYGKTADLATGYNVIGGHYQDIGDYDLSHTYFNEALVINMSAGDKRSVAHSYNNIAISYFYQDKLELSKSYFNKALKSRIEVGDKHHISESYYNLGDWFFLQNFMDSASFYYTKSYDVAKEADSYSLMTDALIILIEVEKSKGAYLKALDYYEEFVTLKEKQLVNSNKEDLAVLEFDRQMAESKKDKMFLSKEQETTNTLILSGMRSKWLILVALFVICVAIILILMKLVNERKKFENECAIKDKMQKELNEKLEVIIADKENRDEYMIKLLMDVLPLNEDELGDSSIAVLGEDELRKTRRVKLDNNLMFYWDAPLGLTESLLFKYYLLLNKLKIESGNQLDELLSGQQIIEDHKVQWFVFDEERLKITAKSGFQVYKNGERGGELSIDEESLVLFFHKEIPNKQDASLKQLEIDLKMLTAFSVEMMNKLTKDTFSKTGVLENHVLFMLNKKKNKT